MDSKSEVQVPSVWLKVGLFGEYFIEEVNDPFLSMVGIQREELLNKKLLKSRIFDTGKGKNLSKAVLKTALDFVRTYHCRKRIEKYYHLMADSEGKLREFSWEVECHPIDEKGKLKRIRLDIKNLAVVND